MDTVDILRALVSFQTVSERSNIDCINWIDGYLLNLGFKTHRIWDETGQKANLVASTGDVSKPGYVLSGHTDVVPVEGQDWFTDPYKLQLSSGKAYGRGTCDMKGFLAVCLALAPEMADANLAKPIHMAFSYDEEVGCVGAKPLTRWILDTLGAQECCFVGEPTNMQVVIGHKGNRTVRVKIRGRAAHSSLAPFNVNAIHIAAKIMTKIEEINHHLRFEGPFDNEFDVPFSTTSIGTIHGGTASNITAQNCEFEAEFRTLPGVNSDHVIAELEDYAANVLEPEMKKTNPESAILFEEVLNYPALSTASDAKITTLTKRLAQQNSHTKVAYGTEASLFEVNARTPSIVIGPGSISQAHQANEYIEISELELCRNFLKRVILEAERPG